MIVNVYAINQETGAETPHAMAAELASLFDSTPNEVEANEQHEHARSEIERSGRAWIGGGAAQLFLVIRVAGADPFGRDRQ